VKGIGEAVALDLKLVSTVRTQDPEERASRQAGAIIMVVSDSILHAAMAHETREQFRILFLDKRNALMADEVQGRGTVDHTPV